LNPTRLVYRVGLVLKVISVLIAEAVSKMAPMAGPQSLRAPFTKPFRRAFSPTSACAFTQLRCLSDQYTRSLLDWLIKAHHQT